MRIAIAGIVHETNTYCRDMTPITAFHRQTGEKLLRSRGTDTPIGAAIDACAARNIEAVPVLHAFAQPSGTIEGSAYHEMKEALIIGLSDNMPVDAVFLDLHGAGVAEDCDDIEADLAWAIRDLIGPDIPIAASFDLHGNVTQCMADALDGVFACREYPHIDQHLRAVDAIDLLISLAREGTRATTVQVESLPILMPTTTTFHGTGQVLRDQMLALAASDPAVVNMSLFHGFPYADVPQVGVHVVVTRRGPPDPARTLARRAAAWIWAQREAFRPNSLSAAAAVEAAERATARPVIINETSDNCGGGAPGDGTHLLRAMLERKLTNACFGFIVDPEVAAQAHRAGVGTTIDVILGGKTDTLHGEPLALSVYVKALHDGRCTLQAMARGSRINYGKLARLQIDGLDIIVGSNRSQTFDTEPFLAVGIDVSRMDYVALKSSQHFRAGFEPIAGTIVTADPPGLCTQHVEVFPHPRAQHPLWPTDENVHYPG